MIYECSFCGRLHNQVENLVANEGNSAHICNYCIAKCVDLININSNPVHILKHPGSIFISYSRKNAEKVRELESDIRRMGYKP
jgi:ATP-dependent protease Clp ATPase subunit